MTLAEAKEVIVKLRPFKGQVCPPLNTEVLKGQIVPMDSNHFLAYCKQQQTKQIVELFEAYTGGFTVTVIFDGDDNNPCIYCNEFAEANKINL